MSDFKAKMQKKSISAGLHRLGSLQRSSRSLAVFKGPTSKKRAGEERGEGRERICDGRVRE